jgi:hypothetical protein
MIILINALMIFAEVQMFPLEKLFWIEYLDNPWAKSVKRSDRLRPMGRLTDGALPHLS